MEIEAEYYRVKVTRSKETGRPITIEWFHDPEPRDDLDLHRTFHAAKTDFDPYTGAPIVDTFYEYGEKVLTNRLRKSTSPEPSS